MLQPTSLRILDNPVAEGERIMTICNSCRYCEGFCAVFPAMERRLNFAEADLNYLANLCHNCAECYYACQYAPPHEFAINVPQTLAQIRARSYEKYAWPRAVNPNPLWLLAMGVAVMFTLGGGRTASAGSFYSVIPHAAMVAIFLGASALVFAAHIAGFLRFWRESQESAAAFFTPAALIRAARDVLTLKNLSSNGAGCTYPNEQHSNARRFFHHFTFYGFGMCFASTALAALYHFSGRIAPYPYLSAPVILGTLGGIGLLIGPAGLLALKQKRDPEVADAKQDRGDVSFIGLLILTSATGLTLLVLRETAAMPALLRIHLAIVFALFLSLPYGKFVHGIYRSAALLRSALEQARSQNKSGHQP